MTDIQCGAIQRDSSDQQLLERYIAHRDEGAFVGLIERYSRTVWSVCRRVLHQQQDIEDAFQAVFLVLVRKAASIRKGEAVGSWLYGVAYRTAMRARRTAARREEREKKAPAPAPPQPPWGDAACREVQRLLDEEVDRLPDKYRAPFVLCCLEGMSKPEAARELGWKDGTVSGRLAKARKLLQARLARRGITLSAALTAIALAENTAVAAAPTVIVQATIQNVVAPAAGKTAAFSPSVKALASDVVRSLVVPKALAGLAILLGLAMLATGVSMAAFQRQPDPPPPPPAAPAKPMARNEVRDLPPAPRKPGNRFDGQVHSLVFSPDAHRLVTVGGRADFPGQLVIFDVATGKESAALDAIPGMRAVVFSPDGATLATGEFDGEIRLRDPDTGKEQAVLEGHPGGVNSVAFGPDSTTLVSGGMDNVLKLWDVRTRQVRQVFEGHDDAVQSVAMFHDGKKLVSGSRDLTARIWDVATGKEAFVLAGHRDTIEAVAVSPDDRFVATASRDRTVRLWSTANGQEIAVLQGHRNPVLSAAFSVDGSLLAAGAADGRTLVWNVQSQTLVRRLDKQASGIRSLAFSSDGKYLSTGSPRGAMLFSAGTHNGEAAKAEYHQSFKDGLANCPGWELRNGDEQSVRFEPDGLRIIRPLGNPGTGTGTGAFNRLTVRGDFEITVGFEILQEPLPADAGVPQTRVSLEATLAKPNPEHNVASISRRVIDTGTHFSTWRVLRDAGEKEKPPVGSSTPTRATTGRLRLVRTGPRVSFYAAEGTSEEFTLLKQCSFGTEDLREVRLVASTGSPRAAIDVRLFDLQIRADSLPNVPALRASAPPAKPEEKSGPEPLRLIILAVAFVVVSGLSLFLWLRQRRRAEPAMVDVEPLLAGPEPEAVSPPITVTCPGCGKTLRAKAELAGKKVKCPKCAAAVMVADAD